MESMGAAHRLYPSDVGNWGDPAAYVERVPTWPLPERAALLADIEPWATLRFGRNALTQHLHLAHAEEAVGFADRRYEGRRITGRERPDREDG